MSKLWDFSVSTYDSPSVSEACLSLQNDYGADVNMLFFCCWVSAYVGELDSDLLVKAARFSGQWTYDVVLPIRSARRWLKHTGCHVNEVPSEACIVLRGKIKAVELETEKLQQEVLESLVPCDQLSQHVSEQAAVAGMDALKLYAEYVGIKVSDDVQRKFSLIIDAVVADRALQPSA